MIKEINYFFKEHKNNSRYILNLALSSAKEETQKTTLGMYWNVFRDAVFFMAYTFFMLAVRGVGGQIEGMPRLVYLYTGLVAWYLISDYLNGGVKCILKNKHIFTKIKFPILIIPTFETLAIFIKRWTTFTLLAIILGIIMITTNYRVNINIFGLIYSLLASLVFGIAYSLLMSGFYTISKDFRELYKAIVRIQFYFVPIFWSVLQDIPKMSFLPSWAATFLQNTPFIHLINTFRYSISLGQFPPLSSIAIFMSIVFVMFALGCYIQYRLQRIYADFV
ncbi:ABC transporter permease [Mycoplasma sp. P36-A1]|uniref:ABC transporter permease n=1 Tax=Mycoplasma sp. P36-A1 TaxID=3252900 RepID=UPI003C2E9E01